MLDWQSRYTPLVRVNLVYLSFDMRIELERCDLLPNPARNRRANQFVARTRRRRGEISTTLDKRLWTQTTNPAWLP
jgi:hypothetical protein